MPSFKTLWSHVSVWTLIGSNLIPLYGVLVHGWEVFPIMLLFWSENVVIGVMNVARMVVAQGEGTPGAGKAFMIPFFCVHYGIFTLVHGVFVFALFGGAFEGHDNPFGTALHTLDGMNLWLPFLALVASHVVSFFTNFIGHGEYKTRSLGALMAAPYARVVILHITILGGGFLAMSLGSPAWALAILVVLKILVDLGAHLFEHRDSFGGGRA